uniref:Ketimine reductase mu-crystallin n=1 Tax=Clastoptera arizonana TaxID=38151 RepID=A0A1B6CA06_9HEMI
MANLLYLDDSTVKSMLKWTSLIEGIEKALGDLSLSRQGNTEAVIQPPRLIMPVPQKDGALLSMPAYLSHQNALACKIVTSFRNNAAKNLPSINATILLFDGDTGQVKAVMDGTEITAWRTAAASVVATKHIHRGKKQILAILGAGMQGRSHALAFKHFFEFSEIRIWNRTFERAKKLCTDLGAWAVPFRSNEECVRDADVIVTATYATEPIVQFDWVKIGAHINAVGFGVNHHNELSHPVYENSLLIVDSVEAANKELSKLIQNNVPIVTEVGSIINKSFTLPSNVRATVFHSLGMAVEDVVSANLVYNSYMEKIKKPTII